MISRVSMFAITASLAARNINGTDSTSLSAVRQGFVNLRRGVL
jgi:hypothetical protein